MLEHDMEAKPVHLLKYPIVISVDYDQSSAESAVERLFCAHDDLQLPCWEL